MCEAMGEAPAPCHCKRHLPLLRGRGEACSICTKSPRVFAAIVVILVLSVVFDIAVRFIERRTLVWQTAGRRERAPAASAALPAPAPA